MGEERVEADGDGAVAASGTTPVPAAGPPCQNCGTPLLGEHCYRCGQPVKGLVRHFTSILGDFLDSVFDFDSRTLRTLWPLYGKPGYLTCEYFEGRRVRYVSPVRLFFFLTIVAFFVGSLTLHVENSGLDFGAAEHIKDATTVEEVERLRERALAELPRAQADAEGRPAAGVDVANETRRGVIIGAAATRIEEIREAEAAGIPVPMSGPARIDLGDGPWHPDTNPVEIRFLPGFANDWINDMVGRAQENASRLQDDPDLYVQAMLSAIPTTLFVLLPLFALMLKAIYLFKRRLYMEHLIVALHSHAFLSLSMLLLFLLDALERWWPGGSVAFGFIGIAVVAWMPVYLLLMQKRVYRQGWPMTLLKYLVLGFCYFWLMLLGTLVVALGSLVWM